MNRSATAHVLAAGRAISTRHSNVAVVSGGIAVDQLPHIKGAPLRSDFVGPLMSLGVQEGTINSFRSQQLRPQDVVSADIIIVAGEEHKEEIISQHPELASRIVLFTEMHPELEKFGGRNAGPAKWSNNSCRFGRVDE